MRRKPALCEYPYLGLSVAHKAAWPPFFRSFRSLPVNGLLGVTLVLSSLH